jgi:hypothetical protein
MAALEAVLEQALKLSEKERGELVARLLDSLEADDGSPAAEGSWRAEWAKFATARSSSSMVTRSFARRALASRPVGEDLSISVIDQ